MFDVISCREQLEGEFGYRFTLAADLEGARARNALCSRGVSALGTAIECFFCGLDEAGRRVLRFSISLLEEALDTDEALRHQDTIGQLEMAHQSLALALWLRNGQDHHEHLSKMVEYSKRYWEEWPEKPDWESLDIILPLYLNARASQLVCAVAKENRVKAPQRLTGIRAPRVMACVLAKAECSNNGVGELEMEALRRFLDRLIGPVFLAKGWYREAAVWLKIAYWNYAHTKPSPTEVLVRAYNHMPDVVPPT